MIRKEHPLLLIHPTIRKDPSMTKRVFCVLIAFSIVLSACSTPVRIMSDPSEAEVEINGQPQGKTPLILELSDLVFTNYQIQLKKPGYKEKNAQLQKEFKTGTFVGGLFVWPFLLWCYGPAPAQTYKLDKE